MKSKKICIIGGGNLGSSIAEGILISGLLIKGNLTVTRRNLKELEGLKAKGANITDNNKKAAEEADIIIVAVKPKITEQVLKEIAPVLKPDKHCVISVVTGFSLERMMAILGREIPVFRAMPNTAVSIQESMTCVAGANYQPEHESDVITIFDVLGRTAVIEEKLMEAATVLAACGIAFALRYLRASMQAGIQIGFPATLAQQIAAQTIKGAAELVLQTGNHPEKEIDKVTTPQGCTIAGLNEMEHKGLSSALIQGMVVSYKEIANIK
jgi:pyrroline-5-carboxylate reductase